jgi:hypothetical protein
MFWLLTSIAAASGTATGSSAAATNTLASSAVGLHVVNVMSTVAVVAVGILVVL